MKNARLPKSLNRGSLGSIMESQRAARSMLASLLTFQFLCNSRSSHGSFFASFRSFSSSVDIYTARCGRNPKDRRRESETPERMWGLRWWERKTKRKEEADNGEGDFFFFWNYGRWKKGSVWNGRSRVTVESSKRGRQWEVTRVLREKESLFWF